MGRARTFKIGDGLSSYLDTKIEGPRRACHSKMTRAQHELDQLRAGVPTVASISRETALEVQIAKWKLERSRLSLQKTKYTRNVHRTFRELILAVFDIYFHPVFKVSTKLTKEHRISAVVTRQLLALLHSEWMDRLTRRGLAKLQYSFPVNEAYTTACCSRCGRYNPNVGSSKVFHCPLPNGCGYTADRDAHAALNAAVKALHRLLPAFVTPPPAVETLDGGLGLVPLVSGGGAKVVPSSTALEYSGSEETAQNIQAEGRFQREGGDSDDVSWSHFITLGGLIASVCTIIGGSPSSVQQFISAINSKSSAQSAGRKVSPN